MSARYTEVADVVAWLRECATNELAVPEKTHSHALRRLHRAEVLRELADFLKDNPAAASAIPPGDEGTSP